MSKELHKKQKGFTLVELSIVLVIIGLIISSVLVGQDLVRSAELRAVVSEYESFNAAVGTFRGKYGGMPGDVDGATDYGFVGDGDGDGLLVATGAGTSHAANENVFFWNHLGSTGASMISGSYDGVAITNAATLADGTPQTKVGEHWGVFTNGASNFFMAGITAPDAANNQTTTNILNPLDAKNIDDKIDDGRPMRGIVQAREEDAIDADTAPTDGAAGGAFCVTGSAVAGTADSTAEYNTQQEGLECTLRIRFNL
jgi:prepilin-type N-terminal cleavage/methylation domain-containing protein